MWIPSPIYERIPQFWFLLGLLFFANGLYLGFEFAVSFGYLAVGAGCCVYGIGIAVVRMKYRRNRSAEHSAPANSISDDEHSATVVPPDPF